MEQIREQEPEAFAFEGIQIEKHYKAVSFCPRLVN